VISGKAQVPIFMKFGSDFLLFSVTKLLRSNFSVKTAVLKIFPVVVTRPSLRYVHKIQHSDSNPSTRSKFGMNATCGKIQNCSLIGVHTIESFLASMFTLSV